MNTEKIIDIACGTGLLVAMFVFILGLLYINSTIEKNCIANGDSINTCVYGVNY